MSAVPVIPDSVSSPEALDAWIDAHAGETVTMADRMRFAAAIMERAGEIGDRQRGKSEKVMTA